MIDAKKTQTGTSPGRWVVVVLIIVAASWGLWSIFATDDEESVEADSIVEPKREVTAVEVRVSDSVPTLPDYDAGSSDEEDYEIEDWEIPLPSPRVYFDPGKVQMDRDEVRDAMMPVVEYMITTPTALAWVQAYYVYRRTSPGPVYLPAEPDELNEQEREIAQQRANAIRDVLLSEGIPEDRIQVRIRESSPHPEAQRVQVRIIPRVDR